MQVNMKPIEHITAFKNLFKTKGFAIDLKKKPKDFFFIFNKN